MQRCLGLARLGAGRTAPNPLVGSMLVHEGRVLAEGWHHVVGGPHAEVECLSSFPGPVAPGAVMYVSLEPCAHHGRTPPCTDLLIGRGVRHVVVGCLDPDPRVKGRGIDKLRAAGIEVIIGIEEAECRWTNRRFITSIEQHRPYVVLKWARSADGLMDQRPRSGRGVQRISNATTDVLVHRWRAEEQAIVVGSRTALHDDPALTVRHVAGSSPLRVVIDRSGIAPMSSHVFDGQAPTLLFTAEKRNATHVEQRIITQDEGLITGVLEELHRRGTRSVLVEGGAQLLTHWIASGLWDEARIIQGQVHLGNGTAAPPSPGTLQRTILSGGDHIELRTRTSTIPSTWHW